MEICCPKCNADISDTYEPADPSVGIMCGGWYCDACDLPVGDDGYREPLEDDVPLFGVLPEPGEPKGPLGTPLSGLSGNPAKNPAGYEKFKRIAKSWGYD
ncbi:MAG: hypothetical protein KGL39_55935 [Patescibacteria group bacterium]|nr:hypothetical protein [Patescibacteria group bacterium]